MRTILKDLMIVIPIISIILLIDNFINKKEGNKKIKLRTKFGLIGLILPMDGI